MDTAEHLKEQLGGLVVPAESVRELLFPHLSSEVFRRQVLGGTLGLPVLLTTESQKAPLLFDVRDIAEWYDHLRVSARSCATRKLV